MTDERPTVLLVDDEEDVVTVYTMALADDYEVRTAPDGATALSVVDGDVDVVVLDRRMPGLSGREVVAELRDGGFQGQVALVTAVDPDFDIVEMAVDAYLTKPVSDEDLRAVVDRLVQFAAYNDRTRELLSLAERQATLDAEKTAGERADSEAYQRLRDRIAALADDVSVPLEELDDDRLVDILSQEGTDSPAS